MAHSISGLITRGNIQIEAVQKWDLVVEELSFGIKLAYVDHCYTACWQKLNNLEGHLASSINLPSVFPNEIVLLEIAKELKGEDKPVFAVIFTDYFGGIGKQFAQIYQGAKILDPKIVTINQALKKLGVKALGKEDEFNRIGLGNYRSNPDYLEKYWDLADELGV